MRCGRCVACWWPVETQQAHTPAFSRRTPAVLFLERSSDPAAPYPPRCPNVVVQVYACFWSINWLNADVMGAFIRTLVHCGPHYNDTDACRSNPTACVPQPRTSSKWSGSVHCYDRDYVILQQTHIGADLSTLTTVITCFALFALGTFADVYGRKSVMVLGMFSWALAGGITIVVATLDTPESASKALTLM